MVHDHDIALAGGTMVRSQGLDRLVWALLTTGLKAEVAQILVGLVSAL